MSDVVAQELAAQAAEAPADRRTVTGADGPAAERGLVTVEFIFGIILVIAIITVVVSVIHNPAIGSLLVQLLSWILGLIKGVKA